MIGTCCSPQSPRPPPASSPEAKPTSQPKPAESKSAAPVAASESTSQPAVSLGKRKAELRGYLQKKSGTRPDVPTIPRGKPADYYECARQYAAAKGNTKTLYGLIASHLRLAEALLEQVDIAVRRSALGVIDQTLLCCLLQLKDYELGASICDAWLLPHIEDGDGNTSEILSKYRLLLSARSLYVKAGQHDKALAVAKGARDIAPSRNAADAASVQIAMSLEVLERFAEAIQSLEQIDDGSSLSGAKAEMIPLLKKKLMTEQAKPKDGNQR